MSDNGKMNLTRRKILAGMGAVGAAGAGAGLGTSALFGDTEGYEDNTITAGSLDLKVDWEEHYSFPQIYGFDNPEVGEGVDTSRQSAGDVDGDARPFPPGISAFQENEDSGASPLLWVSEDDVDGYMDDTAIDAFPDPDDDGAQEQTVDPAEGEGPFGGEDTTVYNPCIDGADLDDQLAPGGLRTDNDDTAGSAPLINLEDVKPGDFGEVTLSTHLCDNDGYLWFCGELDEEGTGENDVTDPEGDAPGEGEGVELLDEVQTALWYDDNGNNLVDPEVDELDLVVAVDTSGSIGDDPGRDEIQELIDAGNALANSLAGQVNVFSDDPGGADVQVGLLTFGDSSVDIPEPVGPADPFFTSNSSGNADLGQFLDPGRTSIEYTGNTPMAAALLAADAHLDSAGRAGAEKSVVLVTDGGPNYDDTSEDVTVDGGSDFTVSWSPASGENPAPSGEGGGEVNEGELKDTATQAQSVRDNGTEIVAVGILDDDQDEAGEAQSNLVSNGFYNDLNDYLENEIASSSATFFNTEFGAGDPADIASLIAAQIATGDEVFFTGSLRDALDALEGCVPLDGAGDTTEFDEITSDGVPGDDTAAERDPFDASTDYYFGFSWWVPTDVGNEIQSDTVAFDLGFHAQQARNNDGAKQT